VSDLLMPPSDDDHGEDHSRRRAVRGLLALAVIAGLVVALVILIVGMSGGGHRQRLLAGSDDVPDPTLSTPSTTAQYTTASTRASSTSPSPTPTRTGNPCPSREPCAVDGDIGGAVAAVNRFRVTHGAPTVPGAVTPEAQHCALSNGDGSTCQPHFSWEPVPSQDGARVISLITGRSDGQAWLLDPGMTSFSVGWAYVPGPGDGQGQWECAILKP
jgi:hypothetical protein